MSKSSELSEENRAYYIDHIQELQDENEHLEEEKNELSDTIQEQAKQIKACENDKRKLTEYNKELLEKNEEFEYDNKSLAAEKAQLLEAIGEKESEIERMQRETIELQSSGEPSGISEVDDTLEVQGEEEDPNQEEEIAKLKSENSKLEAKVRDLTEKNQGEEEARLAAEKHARKMSDKATAAEKRERQARQEKEKLEAEYVDLPVRLQEMKDLYKQAELKVALAMEKKKQAEAGAPSPSLLDELEDETSTSVASSVTAEQTEWRPNPELIQRLLKKPAADQESRGTPDNWEGILISGFEAAHRMKQQKELQGDDQSAPSSNKGGGNLGYSTAGLRKRKYTRKKNYNKKKKSNRKNKSSKRRSKRR